VNLALAAPRPETTPAPPIDAAAASASLAAGATAPPKLLAFPRRSPVAREEAALVHSSSSDEDLVRAVRSEPSRAPELLDELFRRYQTKVAAWCARVSGRRDEAADLAQEVFLRVHERLDQFRFESAFATWLYLVTRSVAINRGISNRRRDADSIDEEGFLEPADPSPGVEEAVLAGLDRQALRAAVRTELEPLEARVLHLHFIDELPLAAIDRLLGLENKSGSKAYIVSAKRKLRRHFGSSTEPGKGSGARP
jgi:RNA polymerase sigma-70 factor (ECF subfamily)